MRIMDGLFAFPIIILAIAMMAVMGFGVRNVIIAVAVGFIAPFARVTRGDVLAVKEEPYIEAARLAGVGSLAIIFRHVLPNVLAPIIVQGALRVSGAIITESGLSFLGLGPPPPTPAWGRMIAEGQTFIVMAPARVDHSRHRPHAGHRRAQPPGRRAARHPRPADAPVTDSGAGPRRPGPRPSSSARRTGPLRAVDEVSFQIRRGEIVGLVGESGAGKSLTSEAILGLIRRPPGRMTGEVWFRGRDLLTLDERRARPHPRQGHRDDLPEPGRLAEPGVPRGRADAGGDDAAPARAAAAR